MGKNRISLQKGITNLKLETENLSKGLYILKLESAKGLAIWKFIKE